AHLQGMGSIANVAREKSLLLAAVENPRHCYCPSLCLEYMDFQKEGYQVVAEAGQSVPSGKWNLRMYSVETYTEESKITLQDIPNTEFRLASTGPGMVSNAALAIALACDLGRPIPAMISALANWRPSNMRAQWKEWQGRLAYVDCYNSNPRS